MDLQEAVVAVGGGHAGEHEVGEAEGDLVLGQHEAATALVLHVPPQPGQVRVMCRVGNL